MVKQQDIRNILITNVHSYWNAGDAALTDVSMMLLSREFPNARFTLAMNDPESYKGDAGVVSSFMTWCKNVANRWIWWSPIVLMQALLSVLLYRLFHLRARLLLSPAQFALIQAYYDADIIVSCAGNFLYTSGRIGLPFLLSVLAMIFGIWAGKPLYAMPQSVGPIHRKWQQAVLRYAICRTRRFLIRDTVSWEFLEIIGVNMTQLVLVPDVAFAMPEIDNSAGANTLQAYGISQNRQYPILGVTAINWAGQQRAFDQQHVYETALTETLDWFINTYKGKVIFFPQVCGPTSVEDDRVTAQRIASQLRHRDSVIVIDHIMEAEHLLRAYGELDAFLGTRLHSCIFALSQNTPVLPIAYQHKTLGVFAMLDLPLPVVEIDEATPQMLIQHLQALLSNRESLKGVITDAVTLVREQASLAATYISKDVDKL